MDALPHRGKTSSSPASSGPCPGQREFNRARCAVDVAHVIEVLKFLPVFLLICGPPLVAGFVGAPVVGWLWASGLVAMAIIATVNEPDNYDMPGFGLRLFGTAAVLAVSALLIGMALRRARPSLRPRQR